MILAQLTITVDDKGQVTVNGPLEQLMLCYGLLEMAKDTLRRHNEEQQQRVKKPGLAEVATFGRS